MDGEESGGAVVGECEFEVVTCENAYSLNTTGVAQAIPVSRIYRIGRFYWQFSAI